ncbi:MAG: serine/threonine protein kinase [Polyangiaceae bacterium]|nr:serine/threonine protein kinase [Polyangiaceae bacterium]
MSQPSSRSGVPERIGRFEPLVPIGTGGMATVYLARTRLVAETYRYAALKILHQKLGADDGAGLADLVAEAKLASVIRHPNVVPVLSVEEDPPWVALVMEYVEGETISGLLRAARAKGEKIPPPVIGAILSDVLAGLHAAHEATDDGRPLNLVHRDVSPQNVIVGVDGRARLTDFGIAKIERTNATATGLVKGKTGYMAPEQIAGLKLERAVDVWAAGVVAWEMLAGERLFQGDPMPTMLRIVNEIPPRLRTVSPEVPAAVEDVVAGALVHDPKKRPPTADAFRRAVADAWGGFGGLADPAEVGRYVRRLAEEKLALRRGQVAEMIDLRARLSSVTEHAEASARETSSAKAPPPDLATRVTASPLASPGSIGDPAFETRRARRGAVGGVLAAIGVIGAASVWLATRADPAASATSSSSAANVTSVVPAPSAAPRVVVFSSKKAMTAIRVGGREVVTPPTSTLGVPIPEGQNEAEVVAEDGETLVVVVAADATQVQVPFAAPSSVASSSVTPSSATSATPALRPAAKGTARGSATAKPEKEAKDPGLADTPYRP